MENKDSIQIEKIDIQDNQRQIESENNVSENISTENENFETYSGLWTENGVSHDMVITNEEAESSVVITNKNELNGCLYSR